MPTPATRRRLVTIERRLQTTNPGARTLHPAAALDEREAAIETLRGERQCEHGKWLHDQDCLWVTVNPRVWAYVLEMDRWGEK